MQQLKDNILVILKNKGLTIRGLETKAGLSQSFVNNLLSNRSKNPGIDAIMKIAEALDVTVDELLCKELEHKTHDIDIGRKDIFLDASHYLLKAVENKPNNSKLNLEKLFDAIYVIYIFSLKDRKFDEEFADWFIKSRL